MGTFCCEELLLRGGPVVDAVKSKRELLGPILGVGDLDNGGGLALLRTVGSDNHVLVQLLLQEGTYAGYNANRHANADANANANAGKDKEKSTEKNKEERGGRGCLRLTARDGSRELNGGFEEQS